MLGQTIVHYRILEKLGQGGMGEVFLALDTNLNRKLALKFLPENVRSDPVAKMRLLREARTAATLDHPFICKVYEAREQEDLAYIAMEFVQGRTLRDRLMDGPVPPNELVHLAIEVAEALAVAHDHGIVHRDLKPANIMLGRSGHVKVMDFGLAKQVLAGANTETLDTSLTAPGTIVGTIDYMSPEQLRGQEVDSRSDIFAFGTLLSESITGTHPFKKPSAIETASAILNSTPHAAMRPMAAVPALLHHIIRKALAPNPQDRYQKIQDMLSDLRHVRSDLSSDQGRRLAAIMFTDIVGYSAKTQRNEALAMQLLEEHWKLLRPIFPRYEGQEIKTIGDAFLVRFPGTLQATQCAVEIQRVLFERNKVVEPDRAIEIRIGLHLGDIIYRDNDVFGDGVNIASRIEPLAQPGGICITEDIAHQVRNKIDFPLAEIPDTPQLKNIETPIRIFEIVLPWLASQAESAGVNRPGGLASGSLPRPMSSISSKTSPAGSEASETAGATASSHGSRWKRSRRWILGFATSAAVLAAIILGSYLFTPKQVLSFAPRDWLLIADFENQTGESVFDRSLDTALSVSIEQSQYANVLPRSRINSALQRMGKKMDERINEQIGREICMREKVRGLILPGIAKIGSQYVLTAKIVDPQSGNAVKSYMEELSGHNQVLSKLGELAAEIRQDLGESLGAIQVNSRDLKQATTPSLEALKFYTEGAYLWDKGQYGDAIQLYQSALKIDPDFAMVHNALGVSYASFIFNDITKAKRHFEKAISLVNRVTERERLTIQIGHASSQGDKGNEINLARLYLRSYPDDLATRYNMATALRDTGRIEEAIGEYKEIIRTAPNYASAHINLATCYSSIDDYEQALKSYDRAFALEPTWMTRGNLNHEYGFVLVKAGKLDEARGVFTKALSTSSRLGALRSMALLDMYQGKYKSAEKLLEEAIVVSMADKAGLSIARNHLFMSLLFDGKGEKAAQLEELNKAFKTMETLPPVVWLMTRIGAAYARMGATEKASRVLAKIRKEIQPDSEQQNSDLSRLEGEIELAKGNKDKALQLLMLADRHPAESSFTTGSLANAYRTAGNADAAIGQYEKLITRKGRGIGFEPQQEFLAAHYFLARLYRDKGENGKALTTLGQLLQLWKEADPDLPLLRESLKLQAELQKN